MCTAIGGNVHWGKRFPIQFVLVVLFFNKVIHPPSNIPYENFGKMIHNFCEFCFV